MTTGDAFVDRLSDYLDGELSAAERAAVDLHLRSCGECRTALSELRAVADRAAALADTPPDADLWPAIAARLGAPSARSAQVTPFPTRPASRRFSFTLPQIAAASLALMVLSGGIVWLAQSTRTPADLPAVSGAAQPPDGPEITPANFAEPQYEAAIADLERILEEGRTNLDPETIRILEANLEAIDRAIDQCRRALAADPGNAYLNTHLASARQRKLALLRRATALTTIGG